ncbi:MAG: helix-turn-helix domain-containing protein, partial [Acidimicrobiales bacterium]
MGEVPKAVGSTGGGVSEARQRFGRLLADAMTARGMKQEDLAGRLGTTQSTVSGWINGRYEPSPETVFAIERTLELEPGHLSRPLGYLPADDGANPVSVEGAIAQSPLLDDDQKAALIGMYQVLVTRSDRGLGPARASTKAAAAGRTRMTAAIASA